MPMFEWMRRWIGGLFIYDAPRFLCICGNGWFEAFNCVQVHRIADRFFPERPFLVSMDPQPLNASGGRIPEDFLSLPHLRCLTCGQLYNRRGGHVDAHV